MDTTSGQQITPEPSREAVEQIRESFQSRMDEITARTAKLVCAEIPGYGRVQGDGLLSDVALHAQSLYQALLATLSDGRSPNAEDLAFIRVYAGRRISQGVPLKDFLQAFRFAHRVIWESVTEVADEGGDVPDAALPLANAVNEFVNAASAKAAETYLEAEQILSTGGNQLRQEVLEDLMSGREIPPGPRLSAAKAGGIHPSARFVVITAAAPDDLETATLRSSASVLANAAGATLRPMMVTRGSEIVIVRTLNEGESPRIEESLRTAWDLLESQGVNLTIGASTIHQGLKEVSRAYDEARTALDVARRSAGVVVLQSLSAMDYLALLGDDTARRLIAPEVFEFLVEDASRGRVLTDTLLEYAACDLNVKAAAERLFIHANTAHYRLGRIEEKTDRNLRRLEDVMELLLAVRLLDLKPPG